MSSDLSSRPRPAPANGALALRSVRTRTQTETSPSRTRRPLSFPTFTLPLLVLDLVVMFVAVGVAYESGVEQARQVVFTVASLAGLGLYRPRFSLSVLDELPAILGGAVTGAGAAALLPYLWAGGVDVVEPLKNAWPIALAALGVHTSAYAVVRFLRSRGRFCTRTVVVGAGTVGARLIRWARQHPEYGMLPVGVVDVRPPTDDAAAPYLGEPGRLPAIVNQHGATNVVVAFGLVRETELLTVFRASDRMNLDVHLVPRFFEMRSRPTWRTDRVFGMPLARLRHRSRRTVARRVKRLLDIALSALALVALAPVLGVLALLVRIDGGPGVIFRQERVGRDGRPFRVYKFRSLRPASEQESATTWNVRGDARMSLLGKVIRVTSLDELPQLVNILRGDMSIVGPRPERPYFVNLFREELRGYDDRHRVETGLTGLAAVQGMRGDTSIEDRVYFDNQYIDNWSPWLDIVVIVRTVAAVFRGSHG